MIWLFLKMKNYLKNHSKLIPFYLFFIALSIFSLNKPFFWDTIQLASKHAHWFYENNFSYFLLPDNIDSGHPPFFGMLLALTWKLFGRNLFVSHLFILPFLLGIIHQAYKLTEYFIPSKWKYFALAILLFDPTLLGQSVLVSPDIPLFFFFLLSLNAIFKSRNKILIIAACGLSLISLRGMMLCLIIALFYFILKLYNGKRFFNALKNVIVVFIPTALIPFIFLLIHYIKKGWIGYHPDSPWAISFEVVNLKGFILNTGLYVWRLIDFGRIFVWLTLSVILLSYKKLRFTGLSAPLVIISLLLFTVLPLPMLFHKSLLAHRYLLPVYFSIAFLTCHLLFNFRFSDNKKTLIATIVITSLILGNFVVYPDKIAKGWDSTLAHIPYYGLRDKMINYLKSNNIDVNEVGSGFPNTAAFKYTDLTNDDRSFAYKDLRKHKYIFYSNIFNDFSSQELDELKNNWILEKEFRCIQVKVQLYRKDM